MKQEISPNVVRELVARGALPDPPSEEDIRVLCCLVARGDCDINYVLALSADNLLVWKRNFLQIKIAMTDEKNCWYTGEEVDHQPTEDEKVLHFNNGNGAKDFGDTYDK